MRARYQDKTIKHHDYTEQKQLGLLCHELNLFIIYYVEISTNQNFCWREFF